MNRAARRAAARTERRARHVCRRCGQAVTASKAAWFRGQAWHQPCLHLELAPVQRAIAELVATIDLDGDA